MKADKCYIKKDDKIKVIAGKDKGKIGKVLKVNRKKSGLLVEKINIVKRHSVMVMCSKCVTPARVKMQRLEDGKKVRICVKCGEALDT